MLIWNTVALDPPLHRCVISMAQLAGHRADAAPGPYDFSIGHGVGVHILRTHVNVENVQGARDYAFMPGDQTLGTHLRTLQLASGLSYDAIAQRGGWRGRSGVQRYFHPDYDDKFLPRAVADKLALAFEGTSVSRADIMALAGMPEGNAQVRHFEGAADVRVDRDLPIYGTALGAPRDLNGKAVEQTMLNTGDVIGHIARPPILRNVKYAYALYVQGQSMSPRFDDGQLIIATDGRYTRPPSVTDDVVVYLRDMEQDDGETANAVLVKKLIRKTATYYEFEQFEPRLTFRIESDKVLRLDRVVPWSEILS